jgi:hypothetical protein
MKYHKHEQLKTVRIGTVSRLLYSVSNINKHEGGQYGGYGYNRNQ